MPNTLQESSDARRKSRSYYNHNLRLLNLCFSSNFTQPQPPPITASPKISQQQHHHNRPSPTANASATSSIMINNFNTFYHHHHTCSSSSSTSLFEPEPESKPADFATAFASQRFFFSSPGRSNSIVERASTDSSASASGGGGKKYYWPILDGSVAVPTYSTDPYADFRRSMQEMVEARPELLLTEEKSSWEALHELLLCYLALNQKSTHKFILRAFSDLLVSLVSLSSSSSSPPPRNSNASGGGGCKKF